MPKQFLLVIFSLCWTALVSEGAVPPASNFDLSHRKFTSATVTLTATNISAPPSPAAIPLADALDTAGLAWSTSGTPAWSGQANATHDGLDAAQSGALGDGETTSMQTTIEGPGAVSFWWKVSSEPSNDRLLFYVNDSEKARISGEVDWQWRTFNIPSGTQTLKWTYSKNGSKTGGLDRAWIDQVQIGAVPAAIMEQPAKAGHDRGWFDQVQSGAPSFELSAADQTASSAIVPVLVVAANEALLTWNSIPGRFYQVFFKDDLSNADWIMSAGGVQATDFTCSLLDNTAAPHRFYWVVEE